MGIEVLLGKTLTSVGRIGDEEIIFTVDNGDRYKMYHGQDCCESVDIEDICGDLEDLVGNPILLAEEVTSNDSFKPDMEYDSFTWTFYKLATIKGYSISVGSAVPTATIRSQSTSTRSTNPLLLRQH